MELELHPVQSDILLVLLFKPKARFRDLNTTEMTTDHFTFHVKRLENFELIEKIKGGFYRLTDKGKEFANRFDTDSVVLERQAKVGIIIVCVRKSRGKKEYLIQQRLKQPFYGYWGFLTGKITWGETVFETAKRELKEETGLTGKLKLVGVKHKMDYSQDKRNLLEDKFFFVFRATNVKGGLKKKFEGGKNVWLTKPEIRKTQKLFDGVFETIKMASQNKVVFSESKYEARGF